YHVDRTTSRPLCEVKRRRARLVLRWGTTWEALVLFLFCLSQRPSPPPTQQPHIILQIFQERPYHVDRTTSRPLCEVKRRRARLVLRWGTTWEALVL
ncbi:unnamed protein product, partial [Scytosiphon promiscuus]